NGRFLGGQLKRVAVAAGDQRAAAAPLFGGYGGGKEIIGLVASRLGVGEAAGGDKFRQRIELLDQVVVEFPSALIGGKLVVAIRRRVERIPRDQHGARLFLAVEPQQNIGKAKDGAGRPVAAAHDRLRQRVIRTVRERVPIDDQ